MVQLYIPIVVVWISDVGFIIIVWKWETSDLSEFQTSLDFGQSLYLLKPIYSKRLKSERSDLGAFQNCPIPKPNEPKGPNV